MVKVIEKIDFDVNGDINYKEFMASTLTKKQLTDENIRKVYDHLDLHKNGINADLMEQNFRRKGKDIGKYRC